MKWVWSDTMKPRPHSLQKLVVRQQLHVFRWVKPVSLCNPVPHLIRDIPLTTGQGGLGENVYTYMHVYTYVHEYRAPVYRIRKRKKEDIHVHEHTLESQHNSPPHTYHTYVHVHVHVFIAQWLRCGCSVMYCVVLTCRSHDVMWTTTGHLVWWAVEWTGYGLWTQTHRGSGWDQLLGITVHHCPGCSPGLEWNRDIHIIIPHWVHAYSYRHDMNLPMTFCRRPWAVSLVLQSGKTGLHNLYPGSLTW